MIVLTLHIFLNLASNHIHLHLHVPLLYLMVVAISSYSGHTFISHSHGSWFLTNLILLVTFVLANPLKYYFSRLELTLPLIVYLAIFAIYATILAATSSRVYLNNQLTSEQPIFDVQNMINESMTQVDKVLDTRHFLVSHVNVWQAIDPSVLTLGGEGKCKGQDETAVDMVPIEKCI